MRILFLTQLFPYPPVCGGTIKSWNILQHLAEKYEVTLISFVRRTPSGEQIKAVKRLCSDVWTVRIQRSARANLKHAAASMLNGPPFIIRRDYVPMMQRTVDELLHARHFDLIYVDHLQMAQYVIRRKGCMKLLDEHNVEWKIIERVARTDRFSPKGLFAEVEWRKLKKWELEACREFDLVFTVTEDDRATLKSACPQLDNLVCLPIGVDADSFPKVDLNTRSKDIVSIATMSWPPNIDSMLYFVKDIYPRVKAKVEGVRLVIAGANPPEVIKRLPGWDSSIEVTGFVDDLAELARRTAAFVVPLRSGSGMRVKVLNAMAMGLPVVSTSVGCEGIGAEDGRHLLIADDPDKFADAVVQLLFDSRLQVKLGQAGRNFVLQNYNWNDIYQRLDKALEMLFERREQGRGGR